jgi:hypothetical protein
MSKDKTPETESPFEYDLLLQSLTINPGDEIPDVDFSSMEGITPPPSMKDSGVIAVDKESFLRLVEEAKATNPQGKPMLIWYFQARRIANYISVDITDKIG